MGKKNKANINRRKLQEIAAGWDHVTYSDILQEIVRQTLTDTDLPNEYPGIVKKLIKHDDDRFCSIDPFYSKTIENSRIFNGISSIGNISEKISALVIIPPLIESEGYDEHMIRVSVPNTPRAPVLNEIILIKFLDPAGLEEPVFVKYPQEYPITYSGKLNDKVTRSTSTIYRQLAKEKKGE